MKKYNIKDFREHPQSILIMEVDNRSTDYFIIKESKLNVFDILEVTFPPIPNHFGDDLTGYVYKNAKVFDKDKNYIGELYMVTDKITLYELAALILFLVPEQGFKLCFEEQGEKFGVRKIEFAESEKAIISSYEGDKDHIIDTKCFTYIPDFETEMNKHLSPYYDGKYAWISY